MKIDDKLREKNLLIREITNDLVTMRCLLVRAYEDLTSFGGDMFTNKQLIKDIETFFASEENL